MADREDGVVAGFFATRAQTVTVEKDLRRIGLTDRDIDVGTPASGRYRLDVREAEDLGSGALDGIVIGTLIGAVIGALFLVLAVPRALEMGAGAIALGVLIGGFWGSFFGGLAGMVVKSAAHDGSARWCEIPEGSHLVLVVARAGSQAGAARKVMRRDGARTFLTQAPGLVSMLAASPAGLVATNGAGSARSEDRDGHERTPSIGIPRGAFLLLVLFLLAVSALWANVYLRVVGRV